MKTTNLGCFSVCSLQERSRLTRWVIPPFLKKYYLQAKRGSVLEGLRVGRNPFSKTKVHWILASDQKKTMGHAVYGSCMLPTSFDPSCFGWHGVIDLIANQQTKQITPNTGIGLYVLTEPEARGSGVARALLSAMRRSAFDSGLQRLLIPLLLPAFTSPEGCLEAPEVVAFRLREDKQYEDLWLRLHVSLGAKVLGICSTSHIYALPSWQFDTLRTDDKTEISTAVHTNGREGVVLKDGVRNYFLWFCSEANLWLCHVPCLWVAHEPNGS